MTIKLSGRRIALIGGAGFIGHNLALELTRRGAIVEIIDSLQVNNLVSFSATKDLVNRDLYLRILHERLDLLHEAGIPVHARDAREYPTLVSALHQIKPDVVIQLAAVAHAGRSNKDPYSTFDHSLRTLENALDWSRGNTEQFIYLSSSMIYGNFKTPAVSEDHELSPIGIYGALKLAGEKIVIAYQQVFDLPYTIIRPSALYGQRCVSRRVGQIFIENALTGSPITVQGDGSDRLDFTYIDDLVSGICLAIQEPAARNQIFNMTYGESRTLLELLEVIKQSFPEVEVEFVERDKLMPFRGTLCVDKARELLGYQPAHPIEKGFEPYIDWYRGLFEASGSR